METFIQILTAFQITWLFAAMYFSWKIAKLQFVPTKPYIIAMCAFILMILARVNNITDIYGLLIRNIVSSGISFLWLGFFYSIYRLIRAKT